MNPSSLPTPPDWRHPWQAVKDSLRLLWRLAWRSDPHLARRFGLLYGLLLGVLLVLGEAFLLMTLAVLRALWLAAPLYPGVARGLERLGWRPMGGAKAPPARSLWRTLHTALWGLLIALAFVAGGWLLVTRGFCGQHLLCLTLRLLRRGG